MEVAKERMSDNQRKECHRIIFARDFCSLARSPVACSQTPQIIASQGRASGGGMLVARDKPIFKHDRPLERGDPSHVSVTRLEHSPWACPLRPRAFAEN